MTERAARAIVVMGVAGVGKSTLGRALADALGWAFVEGDALHPPANIRRMRSGIPLEDSDRALYLRNVAAAIAARRASGVVAACSALTRAHRDTIERHAGEIQFVLPVLDRAALVERLQRREDHFMPPGLLGSQLDAFEAPAPDENVITIDGALPTTAQVESVLRQRRARDQAAAQQQ